MKRQLFRLLPLLALAPLFTGCLVAAAGAGFIVSQQVLPNDVHMAQVARDIEEVWPSVKETLSYYQEPGSQPMVQEFPRSIDARVDGAEVRIEVEAIDIDRSVIRVSAEKYLGNDKATATKVLNGILDRLQKS